MTVIRKLLRKQMYSSTITLECNRDYFNECRNPVSAIKTTSLESLGVVLVLWLCHYLVF